jgi:hypothetical protein
MNEVKTKEVQKCFHCKCELRTEKEKKQDYCEKCWEGYTDEMNAIYGDEW